MLASQRHSDRPPCEGTIPSYESKKARKKRLAVVLECRKGIDLKRTVIARDHGFFATIRNSSLEPMIFGKSFWRAFPDTFISTARN